MKKFWLMFIFVLCGALAFTSCSKEENEILPDEDDQEQVEWQAGLDESNAPDQLILRVNIGGAKVTYVADFEDGLCVKCVVTSEYLGYEDTQDFTSTYKGLSYELVKAAFQAVVDSAK